MAEPRIDRADVVVVGGGPAGMMAALAAARHGARVVLIEQMPEPGLKLLASGGGRCNLTNLLSTEAFMDRFGRQGRFMRPALDRLDARRLRDLLRGWGVDTFSPDGWRVFPRTEDATPVRNAIWRACREARVAAMTRTRVTGLWIHHGRVVGVRTGRHELRAGAVILASGGRSYPRLGATGEGYRLAEEAGHRVEPPCPALVPLVTRERWPARLAGVSLPMARVRTDLAGHGGEWREGPVLFTHRGVSGPAILDLSGAVARRLEKEATVGLRLCLLPERSEEAWRQWIDDGAVDHGRRTARNALASLVPRSLAEVLCEEASVTPDSKPCARLTAEERRRLARLLTGIPLTVVGTEGFERAMVTRGGVSLRDVDPETLESRRTAGLFLAGELLDLDGPTGGFNLQWAFSSGWLAGFSAASASRGRGAGGARRRRAGRGEGP